MPAQFVEAVWVWRYNASAFKSTYGRLNAAGATDNSYSKDYLQVAGACADLLSREFAVPRLKGARQDIEYVWPQGTSSGFIAFSADRFHVAWETSDAPAPWKVTPQPVADGPETIPGDPTHSDQASATKEWDALDTKGLDPFLIAVKLRGETNRLHVRAYLANPPADMPWAALSEAPTPVQEAAARTNTKRGCESLAFTGVATAEPAVADLIEKLTENPNLLLTGPPGTGKTVLLEKLTNFVEHSHGGLLFDPARNHDAWSEDDQGIPGMTRTVVLHPSYGYDNLVVGLIPTAEKNGMSIKAVPGPLVNLAEYARAGGNRALLVLDEFNRGNAAAALGDALALLDKDKRGTAFIDLPFAELGIRVAPTFSTAANGAVSERFTLPPNLWIVAAMNSSDRSVAPLDAALRRRFTILDMPPDYGTLAQQLQANETLDDIADLPDPADPAEWNPQQAGALAVALLRNLNRRIDAVLGTDFRLGQSNFWAIQGETGSDVLRSLAAAFDFRVVPTLRLSLQDDDGALAAILLAGTAEYPSPAQNAAAFWEKPDTDLGTYGVDRLHIRELTEMRPEVALGELLRQAVV